MARRTRLVSGCDQWTRATHQSTTVDGATGNVGLSWSISDVGAPGTVKPVPTRGLAFDRFCRAYRPTEDNVERTLFGATRNGVDYSSIAAPTLLFAEPQAETPGGQFTPSGAIKALDDPVGIAVDDNDRLFISERGRRRIMVVDLWSRRVLRAVRIATPTFSERAPVGIAASGDDIWVVTHFPSGLLHLTARGDAVDVPLPVPSEEPPPGSLPMRITVVNGKPVVLFRSPDDHGWLVAEGRVALDVGPATDITTDADGVIVVAPAAGSRALLRFVPLGNGFEPSEPLDAAGYNGGGIGLTQDGRIAYTTSAGLRLAVRGRLGYPTEGRVVTYRLDSGQYGTRWGRIFVDANLPNGTSVRCSLVTSDDEDPLAIAHSAADPEGCLPYRPELSPPLPPPRLEVPVELVAGEVQSRATSPVPWWRASAADCFTTYEGYSDAAPGRYAWVALRLAGNTRSTPRVREIRIEAEAHTLLRRLPKLFSADSVSESFLQRYLAMFDGTLYDLDARSLTRDLLVDPRSTPEEALSWLASFLGLVLDDRWPVAARRQLVAEAATLYRLRGTIYAMGRYLEIYLGIAPIIVEHYRLRGLGDPKLSDDSATRSRSVLGAGMRIGGAIGDSSGGTAETTESTSASSYRATAHIFSVMIPRLLDTTEESVVRHVLDQERPAHTAYELCTVDAGMRAGRSLHLGLSSVIGRTGGFAPAVLGQSSLDRENVLGTGLTGGVVESARAGSARVG